MDSVREPDVKKRGSVGAVQRDRQLDRPRTSREAPAANAHDVDEELP
jgi:hypothetical protein